MSNNKTPKLYKYLAFTEYSIVNLKNRCLWFSKPNRFNDPFDCAIRFSNGDVSNEQWLKFFKESKEDHNLSLSDEEIDKKYLTNGNPNDIFKNETLPHIEGLFKKQKEIMLNDRGVACFTEKVDDMLMWSHYSDGHRGFCLEFDTNFDPFNNTQHLYRVFYSDSQPIITIADFIGTSDEDLQKLFMKMITTKSKNWSYEQEWRMFHMQGDKCYHLAPEALSAVYLGCLMPFDHKGIIASLIKDSPTRLFEMCKHDSKFGVYPK